MFTVADISPRECGCTFCVKHKPAWFADNAGELSLECTIEPSRYCFGTETADFLFCPQCGVVIAAVSESEGRMLGVFNLNCLEVQQDWSARAATVDYDGEDAAERRTRRAANWMPVSIQAAA
ncbi:hypothetical protein HUO12_02210 [Altererythrobacter sp. JGD-16]|uniref:CENP-V/GFA domain-containing protein n=1 Tax=Altererythrobacter lutimaris TaxID=2743979 RepID=A0A850H777_9SPHN|nr:hypothetical protein [Altererythrobacter lutimaris]NVE93703.1 hypothetical protein [Altererythrobacter lutimaris]